MRLNYRKMGEGKPLFILHGLFGLSDNWATVGKILSPAPALPSREGEKSLTTYLIDLRNHGNSPHSDEWTYSTIANDILELMNDEHLEKINLLGHSLGGKVAMHFASMHPDKLEKLIIADMAPKEYRGKQFDFIEKLLTINLSEIKSRKEAEAELRKIIKDEATIQLLLKNIYWKKHLATVNKQLAVQPAANNQQSETLDWKFNLKVIAENQDKIGKTFSIKENIQTSALFIRGEKSNYILDSDIPQIKKYFPNSTVKTISGAGHWVHVDKPIEFTETVREFIS